MTTSELIKLLQEYEKGGISRKPRQISLTINGKYMPDPDITVSSTGDGICGPELDLDVDGNYYEQKTCEDCCNDNQIEKAKLCQKSYIAGMEHKQELKTDNDCISRQATVEFLEKHAETYEDVRVKMGFKASASLINNRNNLPSVTPTQDWIPTSERNPELIKRLYADGEVTFTYYQSDRVLLQTKNEILIGTYYKDAAVSPHYEADDGYIIASRVIAWMELPKRYEG